MQTKILANDTEHRIESECVNVSAQSERERTQKIRRNNTQHNRKQHRQIG